MPNIFDQIHSEAQAAPPQAAAPANVFGQIHAERTGTTPQVTSTIRDDDGNTISGWLEPIGKYAKSVWDNLVSLPGNTFEATRQLTSQPVTSAKNIIDAQGELELKAEDAFKRGDYVNGTRHVIEWLIPLLGPELSRMGDKAGRGEVAEALGDATVFGVTNALPGSPVMKDVVVPGVKSSLNTSGRAAVAFANRNGIPVPLSVKTGSRAARALEGAMANDLGGSGYASDAKQATVSALRRTGGQLADQVHPTPVTAQQAGESVITELTKQIEDRHRDARQAYADFHRYADDPRNRQTVQVGVDLEGKPIEKELALPVDMRPIKDALRPLVAQYEYTMPQADQRASIGLKALKNIVEGDDAKPAAAAEIDLGMLKEAARSGMPELRDISQGMSAAAVGEFQKAIDSAVAGAAGSTAGQNPALGALRKGRAATAEKYDIADTLKGLGKKTPDALEPVQVFNRLTWDRDSGIQQLRDIASKAPAEMPKVGRAYLEGLLDTATRGGDFEHVKQILNSWETLGPEGKRILFPSQRQINDITDFLELAKRSTENPNPSGTAYVSGVRDHVATFVGGTGLVIGGLAAGSHGTMLGGAATLGLGTLRIIGNAGLARLLYSPKATKLLVEGMRVPLNTPKGAALAAELLKIAGDDAKPLQENGNGGK